jgi:short-subunit dehydrogenase
MPRPLEEQVVVVTGASSGVGRETCLELAGTGASVVLAARNTEALDSLRAEVERLGGTALVAPTDVSDWDQVQRLAAQATERFGRIDTWVNCAAVSLYGTVRQTSVEEITRVLQVILIGEIHGTKAALAQMTQQGTGTIINVASALGKRSVPLQAAYCSAKHGIVGFDDSLRMELEHEGSDIKVVTVLPSSINTPLFEHARSKMGVKPKPVPPIYEPSVVARAIVHAAQFPQREVVVGGGGQFMIWLQRLDPRLAEKLLLGPGKAEQKQRTEQSDDGTDNLLTASTGPGSTTGDFGQKSKSTSLYTTHLELHPARKRALAAVALVALIARRRS